MTSFSHRQSFLLLLLLLLAFVQPAWTQPLLGRQLIIGIATTINDSTPTSAGGLSASAAQTGGRTNIVVGTTVRLSDEPTSTSTAALATSFEPSASGRTAETVSSAQESTFIVETTPSSSLATTSATRSFPPTSQTARTTAVSNETSLTTALPSSAALLLNFSSSAPSSPSLAIATTTSVISLSLSPSSSVEEELILPSTATITPIGPRSTYTPTPSAVALAKAPFEPGSKWFVGIVAGMVTGSLALFVTVFCLLKRCCIRRSDRRRWRKEEDRALNLPWDEPSTTDRRTSLSASSDGGLGSLEGPAMATVDYNSNPVTTGYPTEAYSAPGQQTEYGAVDYGYGQTSHPYGQQTYASYGTTTDAYGGTVGGSKGTRAYHYDSDAREVVLPPSQAMLRHQASLDRGNGTGGGEYRPGEF